MPPDTSTHTAALPPPAFRLRSALFALFVLLVGLTLTMLAVHELQQAARAKVQAQFDHEVDQLQRDVETQFLRPLYALRGARGFFHARQTVTRAEFARYIASRNLDTEFPGIRGFGFIERVARQDLEPFVANEQADGAPNFSVRSPRQEGDLYVVKFLAPQQNNLAAWGVDLGSHATARAALETAGNTGEPTLSGATALTRDADQGAGVLLLLPLYRQGEPLDTPRQRQAALRGFLYAPIVLRELLASTAQLHNPRLDFEFFDGAQADRQDPLFDADNHLAAAPDVGLARYRNREFEASRTLIVHGHPFVMRSSSSVELERGLHTTAPALVGAGGVLLSLALASTVWLLLIGRSRAVALARGMTAELDRMAKVAMHTSNSVLVADAQLRIVWVNDAFVALTGRSREEALGRTPGELLNSSATDLQEVQRMNQALRSGQSVRTQLQNRSKSGRDYWVETEMQPLRDDAGAFAGYVSIETDITAKMQADEQLKAALRFSDGLLRTLNQYSIVSETDKAGTITHVNRGFCQISGYTEEELVGASHNIVNSGVQPPSFWAEVWRTISSNQPWRGEVCNQAKDGSLYWVDSMIAPFVNEQGEIERYISIRMDITARKQLEQELSERNQLLQNILNNIPVGLSVMDRRLNLVADNALFRKLLDFPDSLFAGPVTSFESIIRFNALRGEYGPGDPEPIVAEIVERARHAQAHQFERQRPGGVTIEVRGAPMPGGGFVTSYTDITDRKVAEERVRNQENLLRGAIDAINEAFILFDHDDRMVYCNDRTRQLYPRSADVIVPGGKFEDILRIGAERGEYPSAVGREQEWVAERMATHRAGNSNLVHQLADGRWLRSIDRKLPDGHSVGFRIDITELKNATEAAEQASRSKSQFLANMSHEIRTPMNAILGMLKLMQGTELTTRQLDYVSKTEGAAKSLLGLLNDILDFSKVEAGKMTLDPQPFRLDQLLRDLSVIFSANVGAKPVEVLFDIDPMVPKALVGDAMRLQQVLINLGGNAIKFTSRGEVVLKVEVVQREGYDVLLRFAVRDSGIGIAPENQAHIFDGFSQAEASTTRRFGGTGLGLSICKRLVALMGGELRLDSALGQGSTFHFTLRLPSVDLTEAELLAQNQSAAAPLMALVIDDNPTARDVVAAMVESLGWHVDLAGSGAEAVAMCEAKLKLGAFPYQAIFVDWQMPGMDGWQTSQRLRELSVGEPAPIVVMVTAHGREMLAQRSAQEQSMLDAFLVKPVTASMLFDAVVDSKAAYANPKRRRRTDIDTVGQRLAGLRLLVVEDNLINQQVARELLAAEGAQVEIADNGQLGVQAVADAKPAFDAVLMDIQMPVMDGFDATRAIRNTLGMASLPIIAMTANAMPADRLACLDAGMNEHVGKPFDLNALVGVLLTLTGRDAAPPPVHAAPMTTFEQVDVATALSRLGGNKALYLRTLKSFLSDSSGAAQQLEDLLREARRDDAARQLHTLKGLAATIGAIPLAASVARVESLVKSDAPALPLAAGMAEMQATLSATLAILDRVIKELADALPPEPAPAQEALTPDVRRLLQDLQELSDLLRDSDMGAMAKHEQIRADHGTYQAQLKALDEAIGTLDFATALRHCQDLTQEFNSKGHHAE
jgi:PAS domain S-box-containing protein